MQRFIPRITGRLTGVWLVLTLAVTAGSLTGCSRNPATGEWQLNALDTQQEIRLGEEAEPQFLEQAGGPIPNAGIRQYVSDLGMKLARSSERADLPWEFHALDSATVNAFALPGGKVFITRGLMEKMTDEAQLAGVLGHEIGHVTAEHIGQQMTRQMAIQVGIGLIGTQTDQEWVQTLAGTGAGLYLLSFSRGQEHQADELGLRYVVEAEYDPMALVEVMQILKQQAGGASPPEFLSTHPAPQSRIDEIRQLIEDEYAHTIDNPRFVRNPAAFKRNVLDPLADLPPAQHQPGEQQAEPEPQN